MISGFLCLKENMMLINGKQLNNIAATDRGLAYGDGLFSTIKVEAGRLCLWPFHLQRLQLGAKCLFFPEVDWRVLTDEVELLATSLSNKPCAVIKVIITRGSGGRGYSIEGCSDPLRILSDHDYPHFYQQWQTEGIDIVLCQQQLSINPQLAGLKTLNRLEQVLIKRELDKLDAPEGIVCDTNGYVIEACSANVFLYINQQWVTPKLDNCGVKGVKRRQVIASALKANISIIEKQVSIDDLFNAEAVFLTNALMGIVPIKKLQSHHYSTASFSLIEHIKKVLIEGSHG